jgi:mono/diheme cytochrome c family protein
MSRRFAFIIRAAARCGRLYYSRCGSGTALALGALAIGLQVRADEMDVSKLPPAATGPVDFISTVRPILQQNCLKCHGPETHKSGFDLSTRLRALKGGEHGVDLLPGASAKSPLIHFVAHLVEDMEMPPVGKGAVLSSEQIGLLRAWIDQGIPWPENLALSDESAERGRSGQGSAETSPGPSSNLGKHWAYEPLRRPPLPHVKDFGWARNPVDQFILTRLEAEGLSHSPQADPRTLIRRLYFTLTGLPPTPEEIQAFVEDPSDAAYAALVEELLASPRYGECWARHWLDVVRFAESQGFETNTERANAWPFRDYVIRAFNDDKPFDQFVLEQLAGDAVGADEATGFLVGGPYDAVKSPDVNLTAQQRMDELHDMVSTTGSAFLGATVGCARCHNHKFDPISQTDYYALQAIFAGVQHGERALHPSDYKERLAKARLERRALEQVQAQLLDYFPLAHPDLHTRLGAEATERAILRPAVHPRYNVDRFVPVAARFVRFTITRCTGAEPCLDELEVYTDEPVMQNVALASRGTRATASGSYMGNPFHKLEHLNDGQFGNDRSWISNEAGRGWVQLEFAKPTRIKCVVWSRDREGKYADRLATSYSIEAALNPDDWTCVASSADREPYQPGAEPTFAPSASGLSATELERLDSLLEQMKQHENQLKQLTSFPKIYAGRFEQPRPTYRLQRGEPLQKREQVAPGAIHGIGSELRLAAETPEQERRLALAHWITDSKNPLTARVLVNRLWQHHFGQGIVATPSDFGHMGARPTHPELLDWLALEFQEHGWSIKHIQRLIVLSATYRQASDPVSDAQKLDAGTRLLWRFPPQRLEAEPIRDTILAVSGVLDLRMGGPGFDLFEPNNNYVKVYHPKREFGPVEWRRMIYQSKPRMRLDDTFGTFDCPDAGQVAPRRNVSTTPLQALSLLNSPFMLQQSELFARRVAKEAGPDLGAEVDRAFRVAFGRQPSAAEKAAALKLTQDAGLRLLCRALYNANEFIYVF